MEFCIEKCAVLMMKNRKRHRTEGIELLNQDKIRTLGENETYKYLGILEADTIKYADMKEKKWYLRRTRKLPETKLHSRNLIKAENLIIAEISHSRNLITWIVSLVRYSGLFLKWTREHQKMDKRARKLMTMHKALHIRHDVDRLCQKEKEEVVLPAFKISLHR